MQPAAFFVRPLRLFSVRGSSAVSSGELVVVHSSASGTKTAEELGLRVYPQFISEVEEALLLGEVEPLLNKKKYESSHWDKVIATYRELEKSRWTPASQEVLQRVRDFISKDTNWLAAVHVLDLDERGHIGPHVDSVKFSGGIVAGLSMLSDCVMRFRHEETGHLVEALLPRLSLYAMTNEVRYKYSHEIQDAVALFRGHTVRRTRRVSIMFRDELQEPPPGSQSPSSHRG